LRVTWWHFERESGTLVSHYVQKGSDLVFRGEFHHSLDEKGRVIIPSKIREGLGKVFFMTKGIDGNILLYSEEEWNLFYTKLSKLPMNNKNARDFKRLFLSGLVECEPTSQGRILIPPSLRAYAKIDKEVVITGNGEYAEIWNENSWSERMDNLDPDLIAGALDEAGISI